MLIVLAGRPGVGKSTLAAALSKTIGATWLRIDTIETALTRLGVAVDEVVSSDERAHRRRIVSRGMRWRDVQTRRFEPLCADVVIDTAVLAIQDAVAVVLQALGERLTRARRGR